MNKNKDTQKPIVEKVENDKRNYFSTPSTTLVKQRQTTDYDSFDLSNEPYCKSTARIIIKKYAIKQ